jgi:uncharacterized membrane protein YhaH (DUF805 family)
MSKPAFEDLFVLSGRRNRKSYFLYLLAVTVVTVGISVLAAVTESTPLMVIACVVVLCAVVSGWIVGAQRCRDFGWTGWAILLTLVPVVGWIFPFVMLFLPGNVGTNRYGPDPLAAR